MALYFPTPLSPPAAFRRLCVETSLDCFRRLDEDPAAFRRLCVETSNARGAFHLRPQPPSGGCVLKHQQKQFYLYNHQNQPPSGGCVLKPIVVVDVVVGCAQPPSGGCVLKHEQMPPNPVQQSPAAFRRLCVETAWLCSRHLFPTQPPSGGCVLKQNGKKARIYQIRPAAFGRLCVET